MRKTPKRGDIIRYQSRSHENTMPDEMDCSPKADIMREIPEEVSEMYMEDTPEY